MIGAIGSARLGTQAVFVAMVLVTSALPASAQAPRPARPYRGLFGSNPGIFTQQLSVNASVGTGYSTNLLAEALEQPNTPVISDLGNRHSGRMSSASAGVNYSLNQDRVSASANAGTSTHYYPSLTSDFQRRDYASGALNVVIGKGLSANMQAAYEPYSTVTFFPVLLDARTGESGFNEDFVHSNQHYVQYGAGLAYNHQMSARTTLTLDTGYRVTDSSSNQYPRYNDVFAGGLIRHNLTQNLGLRMGYQYGRIQYSGLEQAGATHGVDVGVDYNKPLSASRKTTVSFSTGAVVITSGGSSYVRAIGSAGLGHEIGRSWYTSVNYSRDVGYHASWTTPVFSDSVTAALGGFVTQRLQVQTQWSAANGSYAFANSRNDSFWTYYFNADASYALNRFISTGVTYDAYNHEFSEGMLLAPGFPAHVSRQSVRAYVSFWAPVFQRRGGRNGSR